MEVTLNYGDIDSEFERLKTIYEISINKNLVQFIEESHSLFPSQALEGRDIFQRSLLHYAAMGDCTSLLHYLLQSKPDIDSRDMHGRTPLSWAAEFGSFQVVMILVSRGANVNAKDDQDSTPLTWLIYAGNPDGNLEATEAYLKEMGAKETGAKETGAKETGAKETGAKETGVKETGVKETGVKETGPAATRKCCITHENRCRALQNRLLVLERGLHFDNKVPEDDASCVEVIRLTLTTGDKCQRISGYLTVPGQPRRGAARIKNAPIEFNGGPWQYADSRKRFSGPARRFNGRAPPGIRTVHSAQLRPIPVDGMVDATQMMMQRHDPNGRQLARKE
ncbi:Pc22g26470 [Talaromyces islandicus]|uniref:Pc22g26470 n=1 Tax=Talaromyces islandicus TaxID=28573 RepID=A0A0U1MAR0_TALIS|nr:Pc22g26470 [Talaromyces islandicus]